MADDIFEHPRLVSISDALDLDRSDVDAYLSIATRSALVARWTSAVEPARSRFSWPTAAFK
jgi:hypothetical protein